MSEVLTSLPGAVFKHLVRSTQPSNIPCLLAWRKSMELFELLARPDQDTPGMLGRFRTSHMRLKSTRSSDGRRAVLEGICTPVVHLLVVILLGGPRLLEHLNLCLRCIELPMRVFHRNRDA